MTVVGMYIFELLLMTYRNRDRYTLNRDLHAYGTRAASIYMPCPRLDIFKASPGYMGPKLFNMLPSSLKDIAHLKSFRRSLCDLLTQGVFYSVEEFVEHLQSL